MPNSKTLLQTLGAAFCAILCALSSLGGGGMMVGARTAAWAKSGAPLPYDAEVEYLESTGTQYIDTLIRGGDSAEYEIDFVGLSTTKWDQYFSGANGTGYAPKIYYDQGKKIIYTLDVSTNYSKCGVLNERLRCEYKDGVFYSNGVVVRNFGVKGYGPDYNFWVFNSASEPTLFSRMRLYALKMWKDGELVRDYQLVRFTNELGQTEGAMYDRVSGQLFRNAGTGAFVIGPDKT